MDMSASYVKAAKQVIPLAENKIVHDRFHVMQMAKKAVDNVRREEHRQLMKDGGDSFSKTRYVWLRNFENLSERNNRHCSVQVYDLQQQTGEEWVLRELLDDL